jgi:hypothetical protein
MNTALSRAERDQPRPFLPSDMPRDKIFVRAVCAHIAAAVRVGEYPEDIARRNWPKDAATLSLVQRSASNPGQTTGTWGDALATQGWAAFLASLQPSAGASLIAAGSRFDLSGRVTVHMPRASSTGAAHWVAEGAPIPVPQATTVSVALGPPCKLALIESITREIAEHADGESVAEMIMSDSVRLALETALFGNAAGTATNPPGLLNGVSASTASTGPDGYTACLGDIRIVTDAIVAAGGGQDVRYFTSPGRKTALDSYMPQLAGRTYGSTSIPSAQLVGIDAAAFASGFSAVPEISASLESVIVFDDSSTPPQVGTPGTPAVVGAPARSAYQHDLVVLRCILRAAWAMRVPAIAHIDAAMLW